MADRKEFIDNSIATNYYSDTIEQSKENIISKVVTEDYKLEMKHKLLSCIEKCSGIDFDNAVTIKEILNILDDELLLENLSDLDKSLLYANLGDNYFLLGDIKQTLESYNMAFELGNNKIFKKNIFLKIYIHFSETKGNIDLSNDVYFSILMKEIIDNKDDIPYLNTLENDLNCFFVGGDKYLENPKIVSEIIYNIELSEDLGNDALSDILLKGDINLYNSERNKLGERLSDAYLDLYDDSGKNDFILFLRESMVNRFSGEQVDYKEYNSYLKDFISNGFDIIRIFLKEGDIDKGFNTLNFILELGFSNSSESMKGFIVDNLKELIGMKNNDDKIKFVLSEDDYDRIQLILSKNLNLGIPSFDYMMDIGDIFVYLGNNINALNAYLLGSTGTNKYLIKVKELLENLLLEKDFSNKITIKEKNKPELIISLILEKIENKEVLQNKDLEDIAYVLSI